MPKSKIVEKQEADLTTEKVAHKKKIVHKEHLKCQKVTTEEIKLALRATAGLVGYAATFLSSTKSKQKAAEYKMLGLPYDPIKNEVKITRQALEKRLKNNAELREFHELCLDDWLDEAEAKLKELIKDKNLGAICFFLKCKGKKRGYIERQEITGADGESLTPVSFNVAFTDKEEGGGDEAQSKGS